MRACTFCGHRQILSGYDELWQNCFLTLESLIQADLIDCFLIGAYGAFDSLAASVCFSLRTRYPHHAVNLVLPYYRPHVNAYDREWYARFDSVITPNFEKTPYPYRIARANEYMVDHFDIVVAYIKCPGGAAKTLSYAMRRKKRIIHLAVESN